MRIFRYIQLCFLLLSIGVFTSCFDDEGNYEYKEIGEAVIKSIPGVTDHGNKFVCLENEKISLIPEVEFLAGTTAADYEFIWFHHHHLNEDCLPRYYSIYLPIPYIPNIHKLPHNLIYQ